MSKITRQKRKDNYTVVNNDILQNTDLSWSAKGMLVYLLHLPDNWQINVADLSNRSRNGRDGTAGIIKELMNEGYISRVKIKNEKSQFKGYDYTVTDEPVNGKAVNGLSVDGSSVNGKAVTSKYYLKQVLNKVNTIEEPQNENDLLIETNEEFEGFGITAYEIIKNNSEDIGEKKQAAKDRMEKAKESKKPRQPKYIYPPTQEELIQPIYEKLLAKKRDHPNIVDCWNWANHQAEAFWLHHDKTGWKIERLNSAIALWVNKAIGWGTFTKPCPVPYKGNPDQNKPTPTTKVQADQPVLTQQDIEYSQAAFASVEQMFKQMGV
jgi:hypothetical protein